MNKVTYNTANDLIRMDELKIGQFAVIHDSTTLTGLVVVKTYLGVISLSDPMKTWSVGNFIKVRVLPLGTEIKIISSQ